MKRSIRYQAIGVAFWLLACGSDDPEVERRGGPLPPDSSNEGGGNGGVGGDATAGPLVPWCDAYKVLEAKCQRCHQDPQRNGAPMALLTYDDTQAGWSATLKVYDVMQSAVERDFMPYTALNDPPTSLMPPVESLTVDEKATLLGWLDQGAQPEGGTDCP